MLIEGAFQDEKPGIDSNFSKRFLIPDKKFDHME